MFQDREGPIPIQEDTGIPCGAIPLGTKNASYCPKCLTVFNPLNITATYMLQGFSFKEGVEKGKRSPNWMCKCTPRKPKMFVYCPTCKRKFRELRNLKVRIVRIKNEEKEKYSLLLTLRICKYCYYRWAKGGGIDLSFLLSKGESIRKIERPKQ